MNFIKYELKPFKMSYRSQKMKDENRNKAKKDKGKITASFKLLNGTKTKSKAYRSGVGSEIDDVVPPLNEENVQMQLKPISKGGQRTVIFRTSPAICK